MAEVAVDLQHFVLNSRLVRVQGSLVSERRRKKEKIKGSLDCSLIDLPKKNAARSTKKG